MFRKEKEKEKEIGNVTMKYSSLSGQAGKQTQIPCPLAFFFFFFGRRCFFVGIMA